MSGWNYALMAINMVLFWGVPVIVIIGLVRYFMSSDRSTVSRPTPEHTLAERFARGEIDEQEYHQRLNALRGTPRPGIKS